MPLILGLLSIASLSFVGGAVQWYIKRIALFLEHTTSKIVS